MKLNRRKWWETEPVTVLCEETGETSYWTATLSEHIICPACRGDVIEVSRCQNCPMRRDPRREEKQK